MKAFLNGSLEPELIRLLIDNTPVAYIILDEQNRIHYANKKYLELRNVSLDQVIGEFCYNLFNKGRYCSQCAVRQALATGEKCVLSRKDTWMDGTVRYIEDHAIPLQSSEKDGKRYILEIMADRTSEILKRKQRDADYQEMLATMSKLIEAKDRYTATHSEGVREIAMKLADELMLTDRERFDISIAASLHDIGKVRVPNSIINKRGPLSDEEVAVVRSHSVAAFNMLKGLSSFDHIKHIVRSHHERVDGNGYPDRLSADQISRGAKIVAVADTYDAMTSTRSYRKAQSHQQALDEIYRVAGTQLDTDIVNTFLAMDFEKKDIVPRTSHECEKVIERVIYPLHKKTGLKDISQNDFESVIDQEHLLSEIFENIPCGYVLLDTQYKVLFASQYILDYLDLREEEVLGKLCYKAAGFGVEPCEQCSIRMACKSKKVECIRMEKVAKDAARIYDLYGIPMIGADGKIDYIIEMTIDRTAETLLERKLEGDFKKLIDIMTELLEGQEKEIGRDNLSKQILHLHEYLNERIKKKMGLKIQAYKERFKG